MSNRTEEEIRRGVFDILKETADFRPSPTIAGGARTPDRIIHRSFLARWTGAVPDPAGYRDQSVERVRGRLLVELFHKIKPNIDPKHEAADIQTQDAALVRRLLLSDNNELFEGVRFRWTANDYTIEGRGNYQKAAISFDVTFDFYLGGGR